MICKRVALLSLLIFNSFECLSDTVFADFEGNAYPDGWTIEGDAFGEKPSRGKAQLQQDIFGVVGRGFVNSFNTSELNTGTLTSSEFTITKRAINFRLGGGCSLNECALELIVGGKTIRAATGSNTENLDCDGWDVSEFIGQKARLRIKDIATGRWGHITVDHIVFSDIVNKKTPVALEREVSHSSPFLLVPIDNDEPSSWRLEIFDGEKRVRFWNVGWGVKKIDWYAPLDLSEFSGRTLSFRIVNRTANEAKKALSQMSFASKPKLPCNIYNEPHRPQLKLSPTLGWSNDPNGLSYYNGEYHVFFQHNPCGRKWQNMTWGHFVSKDLLHWRDVGDVIHPDDFGPMYSGSAVTDKYNTAGFGTNAHIIAYTAAGYPALQCLAYSVDGRRYTKYDKNPFLGKITGADRDPKVFWHEPTRKWIQCLYVGIVERDGDFWHTIHIFNSPNLKDWNIVNIIYGHNDHIKYHYLNKQGGGTYLYECSDLVELKIDGTDEKRWVIWGGSGEYGIGNFDGKTFTFLEEELKPTFCLCQSGVKKSYYASQTFSNDPKGRVIWLAWMKLETENENFNQGFSIPMSLSLKKTEEGLRLKFVPVEEYKNLRDGKAIAFDAFNGELAEAFFDAHVSDDAIIVFHLRGEKLVFNAASSSLTLLSKDGKEPTSYTWKTKNSRLSLRMFVDRLGLEVLSQDGLQLAPFAAFCPEKSEKTISFSIERGEAKDIKTKAYHLKSIWR